LANNPAEQAQIVAAQEQARLASDDAAAARSELTAFQSAAEAEVEQLRSEITALLDQLADAASGGGDEPLTEPPVV
jgi:hypothetical protein